MVEVAPRMVGVAPRMVGVAPRMEGVAPRMVGIAPGMVGKWKSGPRAGCAFDDGERRNGASGALGDLVGLGQAPAAGVHRHCRHLVLVLVLQDWLGLEPRAMEGPDLGWGAGGACIRGGVRGARGPSSEAQPQRPTSKRACLGVG